MPYKNPQDKLEWQRSNRDKAIEYRKKWQAGPAGQVYLAKQREAMQLQKQANAERRMAERAEKNELTKLKRSIKHRAYRLRQRVKALGALGDRCVVCGMDDPDVLEFDHIEPLFRKSSGIKSKDTYQEVLRHDNPTEVFQLLCANCHAKKTRSNNEFIGPPGKGTGKNHFAGG
jgi:5-methylcytosine-specific restriction endonuclease McrA